MAAVTSARQSPTSRTSPVTQPCLPWGSRLSATARVLASSRPATMTAQPSTARRRAHASPIPDDPPVTRTTFGQTFHWDLPGCSRCPTQVEPPRLVAGYNEPRHKRVLRGGADAAPAPRSDLLEEEALARVLFPFVERVVGDRGAHGLDAGAPRGLILPERHADEAAAAGVAQGASFDEARLPRAGRAIAVHRGDQVLLHVRLGGVDRHVDDHFASPLVSY